MSMAENGMIWHAENVTLYTYGRGIIYHQTISFKTLQDALKAFYNHSLGGKVNPIKLYGTGRNGQKVLTLKTTENLDIALYDGNRLLGYVTPSGNLIDKGGEPFLLVYKEYGKRKPVIIHKGVANKISDVRNSIIRKGLPEKYGAIRIYGASGLIGEIFYTGSPKETVMGGQYIWSSPNPQYPFRVIDKSGKPTRGPITGTEKPKEWNLSTAIDRS